MLLPYIDKGEGVLKGLHNHGEEQERPGYTIQELLQLSRSAVLQQRVIALTSLSNIMAKVRERESLTAMCRDPSKYEVFLSTLSVRLPYDVLEDVAVLNFSTSKEGWERNCF